MNEGKVRNNKSCLDAIWEERVNSKLFAVAKNNIIGRWGDGEAELNILAEGNLSIKIPSNTTHPMHSLFNRGKPNWWDFSNWTLSIGSLEMGGIRFPVYKCNEEELHIVSSEKNILAHVFKRV